MSRYLPQNDTSTSSSTSSSSTSPSSSSEAAMFSCSGSLVLVLLVLGCLESFTTANNAKGASECCFEFHNNPIPLRKLTAYEETRADCPFLSVIFTTQKNLRVCADLKVQWVKRSLELLKKKQSRPRA
ncbi:C-C motif chemokine 26-like [Trichomycterus rosablanca]|uniref:C-C motif chemokine 26-like n=1 Tax=Trichomycterus rosablanca TaxID=2290929 RepID=UPI002F358913